MVFGDEALMFCWTFQDPSAGAKEAQVAGKSAIGCVTGLRKKTSGIILMVGHPASLPSG